MKMNFYLRNIFSAFIVGILSVSFCYGQDTLTVDSQDGAIGILNELIAGDTLDNGDRAHAVYRLKRDQTYLLSGTIENRDYHLIIIAEEGEGDRPRIVPGVSSGNESFRPFRVRDDITVHGLYVTGENELGSLNPDRRIFRVSSTGARVEIVDCFVERDGQSALRLDNDDNVVIIRNSTFANIGQPTNTNNGRLIDDRGNDVDTIILENSTFYQISQQLLRDGGGQINYFKADRNTVAGTGVRIFDLGEAFNVQITNNIFINPGYLGTELSDDGPPESAMIRLDSIDDASEQSINISYNNFYIQPELVALYPTTDNLLEFPGADTPVVAKPYLDVTSKLLTGEDTATNIYEFVQFNDGPDFDKYEDIITQYWADPSSPDDKTVDFWNNTNEPFEFRYQDTFESALASADGDQLGDPQWELILTGIGGLRQLLDDANGLLDNAVTGNNIGEYPEDVVTALESAITSAQQVADNSLSTEQEISDATDALQAAIDAFQIGLITSSDIVFDSGLKVYPNPFTSSLWLDLNPTENILSVHLFNELGQKVQNGNLDVDSGKIKLDGGALYSGIYYLKVRTDQKVFTHTIIKK